MRKIVIYGVIALVSGSILLGNRVAHGFNGERNHKHQNYQMYDNFNNKDYDEMYYSKQKKSSKMKKSAPDESKPSEKRNFKKKGMMNKRFNELTRMYEIKENNGVDLPCYKIDEEFKNE